MKKRLPVICGSVMMLISLFMSFLLYLPLTGEQTVSFSSLYKGHPVTLAGSYYANEDAEYGVLLCPGYSCDRQKLNAVASLFRSNGMAVFSFDYAGQGSSSGTIGFDNARSDAISEEIADAIEEFHALSSIPYERMILVGHSMGGRAILRLLYDYHDPSAETVVPKRPIGFAVLVAPEVNYEYSAQASLFAGTSDAEEEPWQSYNASYSEGTQIYLYGSTGDDIVSSGDIWEIFRHLGGETEQRSGVGNAVTVNSYGAKITAEVVPGVLHSFQFFTVKFAELLNAACADITGQQANYNAARFGLIYASWILTCLGASAVVFTLSRKLRWEAGDAVPDLLQVKRFLVAKLLLWIPGAVTAFAVCCLCVLSPWGSPVMNVPYLCFIAGYGLLMLPCYRKGHFYGTNGKLPKPVFCLENPGKPQMLSLLITGGISLAGWLTLRVTVCRLFPLNFRIPWLVFASVLMSIGFYVSGVERDMLEKAGATRTARVCYEVINYVPLFLFIGFYLMIRSYSGLVQQLINVVLMYILFVPMGEYVKRALQNRVYGALVTAVLFQGMMLTSASLIAIL